MLYTQANEICTHEEKNTIIADHVIKALEQLELQDWIEPVEQALAEFKESKRRAFPRFYFVSSNDLLDILSNGATQ